MSSESPSQPPRRNFLIEALAIVFGAVVSLTPLAIGLFSFLDPFRRKMPPVRYRKAAAASGDNEIFVTTVAALDPNGLPRRFAVVSDKIDAWNFEPDVPIGSVYASLTKDGNVLVFNTTCPHAGCSVAYAQESDAFLCPCHNSSFNEDGSKREDSGRENPSPRGLDTLDVVQEHLDKGEVWVSFANYYTGREDKVAKP